MPYQSPIGEIRFVLDHVIDYAAVTQDARFSHAAGEMTETVLTEAAKLCDKVLAPLQRAGDRAPARLENGVVRTSPGFAEGFRAIADGGWIGMAARPEIGGMGLPMTLTTAINEMMAGACLSLQLNPLMSQGQIEALDHHASPEIKALYLPRLTSGEWTATMNLTEPQAGSDVGALKTRAEPLGDGTYAITGQKIFITWADHDFGGNVCHLVLARLPDGVPGTKGISLFMVPKYLPGPDGTLGAANAVKVISLEHKLGIHGSPTAVMQYDGAKGWLVGAPHQGMAAMFTMMNNARLGVATQGVGQAEAAFQAALTYALERRQGKPLRGDGPIADHADVRRMLLFMQAEVFAARAIELSCAAAIDLGHSARAAFLTPIAKSFCTDAGIRVAELGVQVHGGMGYIEETGAAQYARDVRITAIYEGTNGIQAMDLVGRKLGDDGEMAMTLIDEVASLAETARGAEPALAQRLWEAAEAVREATEVKLAQAMIDRQAGATAYLAAFARLLGGAAHLRATLADPKRRSLADFYIRRMLPEIGGLLAAASCGADGLFDVPAAALRG